MAIHLTGKNNIRLNRYMDLKKFKNVVCEQYLWFNKLNNFDDLHEGRAQMDWKKESSSGVERWRDKFVCNCWNCDEDENFALWNIYLGRFTPGVCIISSYRDILESIVDNEFKKKIENYYVKYVKNGIRDFENLQSRDVITTKYDWYSYENEFRLLMYLSKDNPDKGFKVRVSPQKLIKGIILSPSMDKTYKDEVYEICNTFDISTELIKDSVIEDNTFKGRF